MMSLGIGLAYVLLVHRCEAGECHCRHIKGPPDDINDIKCLEVYFAQSRYDDQSYRLSLPVMRHSHQFLTD